MKEFIIKIVDDKVYINNKLCYFSRKMDKENNEDNLNKEALVALANEMGYEPIFLFEEMAYRLDEMLDDADESFTAFVYEDDGIIAADLSTYDDKEEAIEFAKSRNWDEVVNDITGEVVWRR